ncbi:hypothetical protein BT96DRAFT_971414 [Gymnopus androsaceus JB14]|uniref:Uncharacterized protein n=1 Tax=Gymnopus androsaceus JB14 TaxID=1447944 RepID=A0A6A4I9A0_9AGAR|nr:hypothetical protein BT96DRAFT_971414 [Gymnopus androsaceus JB14]
MWLKMASAPFRPFDGKHTPVKETYTTKFGIDPKIFENCSTPLRMKFDLLARAVEGIKSMSVNAAIREVQLAPEFLGSRAYDFALIKEDHLARGDPGLSSAPVYAGYNNDTLFHQLLAPLNACIARKMAINNAKQIAPPDQTNPDDASVNTTLSTTRRAAAETRDDDDGAG